MKSLSTKLAAIPSDHLPTVFGELLKAKNAEIGHARHCGYVEGIVEAAISPLLLTCDAAGIYAAANTIAYAKFIITTDTPLIVSIIERSHLIASDRLNLIKAFLIEESVNAKLAVEGARVC